METSTIYDVGDRVHISSYRHSLKPKPGFGTVVYVFKAGIVPELKLITKYYGVTMSHRLFPSFNRTLKVDRIVVRRDHPSERGNYLLLPTPALFLIRKIYDWQKEANIKRH
jgi:hypothetical protein